MQPKVSIVISSLNSIKYIEECLESVLNQTLQDIEILCVDANSNDGTLEYLQSLEQKDKRLRVIISDKKSYGYQMNLGIKAAKGEYLGIVESDDTIKLNMYEELYKVAKESGIEVLKCDLENFTTNQKGERIFEYGNLAYDKSLYGKVLIKEESAGALSELEIALLKKTWNMNPPGLYSLNFLRKFRLEFHESAGASYQDTGFWFMMQVLAKRFYYLNESFYLYRRDNENSSCNSSAKVYCICEEYDFMRDFLRAYPKEEKKFTGLLSYLRFGGYCWNLNRIDAGYKLEFLEKFAKDFKELEAKGELDWSYFDEWQAQKLKRILKDPKEYYQNIALKPKGAVDRVKNHLAYRLGFAIIQAKSPLKALMLPLSLIQILLTHKFELRVLNTLYRFHSELLPPALEDYADYEEALETKKHLSYRLGEALRKNPLSFPFKIGQIYREYKEAK